MVSHHVFSQLVLFALIWLFGIVHLSRPKRAVTAPAAPALPEPLTPKRWADENQRYGDKICIGERRNFCSRARSQLRGICYCVCVRFWVK